MKIFRASDLRSIDQYTIDHEPIKSIDLMERAAAQLTGWYVRHFKTDRRVLVFAGPGNNGGDALALARMLADRQYRVRCYLLKFGKLSEDCAINRLRLMNQSLVEFSALSEGDELPEIEDGDVVVDGIFGSGLSRTVRGFPAAVIRHINENAARVVSIDIPSGLFGEDNRGNDPEAIIRAEYTLSFQQPFLSFFFACNAGFVGRWTIRDIGLHREAIAQTPSEYHRITKAMVEDLIPVRKAFSHKGDYGHALLIAGSLGMMGAALLSGRSALRGGCGLLSLHVPQRGNDVVQTALPEAMVSLDSADDCFTALPQLEAYSAIGVGPGLGRDPLSRVALLQLLNCAPVPLVLDADALNLLSGDPHFMEQIPPGSILTPHPGEFDRLAGPSEDDYARHLKQRELASRLGLYIVLKGAYTGVATPEGAYYFNSTGNPGMATGGSGDVLTGLITALLARGLRAGDAALAGVFLHGFAGDLAAAAKGREGMIAGDIADQIPAAFRSLLGE